MTRSRRPSISLANVPHKELEELLRTRSVRAVAQHYGCARNTVRYWRQQLQIPPLLTQPQRSATLRPQLLAWLQQTACGATTAELAAMFDEASLTIYRALCRLEASGQVTRTFEQVPGRWQGQIRWHAAVQACVVRWPP